MKKIELLAPAGDFECLKAAVMAGCDAVYVGGKRFGARAFAGNFEDDEMLEAIKYCHLYGVKLYVTVNTLVYENECDDFINYVRFLHQNGVDAVLLQDLGMLDVLRKKFPNLVIHASTQMNVHNFEGAKFLQKQGVKRVVMARETSLDVIKKITKELNIEVETFIHGALCCSYSGFCLMSYFNGGRSGNRGSCAQCCRKPYDFYDLDGNKLNDEKYLLSMKDLNTLDHLDEIIDAGVTSVKIEGRMKRKEYVYSVTLVYRKAIDNYLKTGKMDISQKDSKDLLSIFNRGFTKGFMLGEASSDITNSFRPNHLGVKIGHVIYSDNKNLKIKLNDDLNLHDGLRIVDGDDDYGLEVQKMFVNYNPVKTAKKGDVVKILYDKKVSLDAPVLKTTDSVQIKTLDDAIKSNQRKVLVDATFTAKENEIQLTITDGVNNVKVSSKEAYKALNAPISKEAVIKQLEKTHETVYKMQNINVSITGNIFINVKEINSLRKEALLILDDKRCLRDNFKECAYSVTVPSFGKEQKKSIELHNSLDYTKYKDRYDFFYTDNDSLSDFDNVILKLPRIINNYELTKKEVLVSEIGSLLVYKDFVTDFSFNVVNSYALAFLHSIGAKRVTLSLELGLERMKSIIDGYEKRYKMHPNVEVINDAYPEVMVSKFNLPEKYNQKSGYLVDYFKNKYLVVSSKDYMTIYNYEKIIKKDNQDLYDIGVNSIRTILPK